MCSSRVNASHNKVGTNVTLVAEKVLFEHRHTCYDTRLAACRQGVELEVGGDDGSGEFGVSGSTGARAPDLRSDIVEFFTVLRYTVKINREWDSSIDTMFLNRLRCELAYLVCYDRTAGGSCVGRNHHSSVIYTSYNGRTSTGGLW